MSYCSRCEASKGEYMRDGCAVVMCPFAFVAPTKDRMQRLVDRLAITGGIPVSGAAKSTETPLTNEHFKDADIGPDGKRGYIPKGVEHIRFCQDLEIRGNLLAATVKVLNEEIAALEGASRSVHDYLRENCPDIIGISTSSELAADSLKNRLQRLHDILKYGSSTGESPTASRQRGEGPPECAARPKAEERTAMGEGTPTNPTKEALESRPPNAAPDADVASGREVPSAAPVAAPLEVTCGICGGDNHIEHACPARTNEERVYTKADLESACEIVRASFKNVLELRLPKMVDRFLAWPLPDSVCSDNCVTQRGYPHRTGTSLLTADEAQQMLWHVLDLGACLGLPERGERESLLQETCMIVPTLKGASLDGCCQKPEHFVYVAWLPGEPGARAACIDEAGYEEHLIEWMAEMVREGCKIQRMTCDQGHELLKAYRRWCDSDANSNGN